MVFFFFHLFLTFQVSICSDINKYDERKCAQEVDEEGEEEKKKLNYNRRGLEWKKNVNSIKFFFFVFLMTDRLSTILYRLIPNERIISS